MDGIHDEERLQLFLLCLIIPLSGSFHTFALFKGWHFEREELWLFLRAS